MFDAYTIKKVMPRLLIAAILIQLSWPLFTGMIYVTSQIAWGLEGLLYAPFGGREALNVGVLIGQAANGGVDVTISGVLGLSAAVGGAVALGPAGLLSLGITVLLALLIAFFVLAIRQVVLVVLLVTAPLALVAWILPNTEKLWKLWWESFSKLLLMYPMILLLVAGGRVAAKIAADVSRDSSANDQFGIAIVVLAFFAPFFLIPKTFQLAGSAFANIAGIANNRSRGAFDRLKNFRGKQISERHANRMSGQSWMGKNAMGGLYRRAASVGTKGSWSPTRAGRQRWQRQEQLVAAATAAEMNEKGGGVAFNDDDASQIARQYGVSASQFRDRYQYQFNTDQNGNFAGWATDAQGNRIRRHTAEEADRALASIELATGGKIGSRAVATAAQQFRIAQTNTAYDPGEAGLNLMQAEMRGAMQDSIATSHDMAGWMKSNRGRAEFSANAYGDTVGFVEGTVSSRDQIAGAFAGADPREKLGGHQRSVETFAEQAAINMQQALDSGDTQAIDVAAAEVANVHDMLSHVSGRKGEELRARVTGARFMVTNPDTNQRELRSGLELIQESRARPADANTGRRAFHERRRELSGEQRQQDDVRELFIDHGE